jgi:hypothetical protein
MTADHQKYGSRCMKTYISFLNKFETLWKKGTKN